MATTKLSYIFGDGRDEFESLNYTEHTTMSHGLIIISLSLVTVFTISTIFYLLSVNDPPNIRIHKRNPILCLLHLSFGNCYLMVFMLYLLSVVIYDSIPLFTACVFNILLDILLFAASLTFVMKWVYVEMDIRLYQLVSSSLYYDLSLFRSRNRSYRHTLRSKCKSIGLWSLFVIALVVMIQGLDLYAHDHFGTVSRIVLLSIQTLIILIIEIKMSCLCCSETSDKDPFHIKLELKLCVLLQINQVIWYIGAAVYHNDNNRWYNHLLTRFIFEGSLIAIHCFLSGFVPFISMLINDNQSNKILNNSTINQDCATNHISKHSVPITPSTFDERFFPPPIHSETNLSLSYHLSSPSNRSQRKCMRMDQAFEKSLTHSQQSKQLNLRSIMVNRSLRRRYLNYLMRSFMIENAWFIIEISMFKAAIQTTILEENINPNTTKKAWLVSFANTSQFDELDLFYVGPEPHESRLISIFATIDLMKNDEKSKHFDAESDIKWSDHQNEALQLEVAKTYSLSSLKRHAMRIYQFYLSSHAEQSINISSRMRRQLTTFFENGIGDFGYTTIYELCTIFDDAFFEIHNLLQSNISGFLKQLKRASTPRTKSPRIKEEEYVSNGSPIETEGNPKQCLFCACV
eukprot:156271_1